MKSSRLRYRYVTVFVFVSGAAKAETCFTQSEVAGIIFGSVFGSFFFSIFIALILWFFFHKHRSAEQILLFEKAHATQETEDFSESSVDFSDKKVGPDYSCLSLTDKFVAATPLLRRRPLSAYQRFLQEHSVQGVENDVIAEHLVNSALNPRLLESQQQLATPYPSQLNQTLKSKFQGLGFDICEDDGIVVADLHPNSPAFASGNIFVGDRLRKVTIDLANMDVDDAFTLLSFIAPFNITVELERSASTVTSHGGVSSPTAIPMIIKSNTFSCHPNTIINKSSPMCLSLMSVQKHALPRENSLKTSDDFSADSESESILPQSSNSVASSECSKMESVSEKVVSPTTTLARSERLNFDQISRILTFSESSTSEDLGQIRHDDRVAFVVSPPTAVARSFQLLWQRPQAVGVSAFYEKLMMPYTQIPTTLTLPRRLAARLFSVDYADSEICDLVPREFSVERFSTRHRPLRVAQPHPIGSFFLADSFQPFILHSSCILRHSSSFCSPLNFPPTLATPEIVEMRVKTVPSPRAPPEVPVIDRQLPELPASALSPRSVIEAESDRLSRFYRSVKRKLRPTSTSTILPL